LSAKHGCAKIADTIRTMRRDPAMTAPIDWSTDWDEAVAAARSARKPLLIDVEKHH
jgi:hypothetical protein